MNRETFLLNGIEVVYTGRIATRHIRNNKTDTLYEVSPLHDDDGSWKKWVHKKELYQIYDKDTDE
jgi:hypothetical protein